MKQRPIEVEVVGNHVRLRVGQTYMHSEEYADEGKARRAARGIVDAINTRPMNLVFSRRGERVVEEVRKVWTSAADKTVVLPVDGGPDQARPPYFAYPETLGQ